MVSLTSQHLAPTYLYNTCTHKYTRKRFSITHLLAQCILRIALPSVPPCLCPSLLRQAAVASTLYTRSTSCGYTYHIYHLHPHAPSTTTNQLYLDRYPDTSQQQTVARLAAFNSSCTPLAI